MLFRSLKYVEIKKKGNLVKEQSLLNDSVYTPDFEIKWHKSALNIFVNPPIIKLIDGVAYTNELTKFDKNLFIKSGECLVEVKPAFDKHNMTRLVNINIKQMMQRHNIFVNLVKIPDLFKKTFTPKKYLFTPTGKNKVINYKAVLLEEYLKNKQNG